jgi:hypothetical protein
MKIVSSDSQPVRGLTNLWAKGNRTHVSSRPVITYPASNFGFHVAGAEDICTPLGKVLQILHDTRSADLPVVAPAACLFLLPECRKMAMDIMKWETAQKIEYGEGVCALG